MNLIKLSAIDSTNAYLKELAMKGPIEDMTVVLTDHQTEGRGQMDTQWHSEPYKNLTFSLFHKFKKLNIDYQPYLNFAVSLAIYETLKALSVPEVSIKWPNDIMTGDKKICGVLVETTLHQRKIKNTIIGIGLNVNQRTFPDHLSGASSLSLATHQDFNLEMLLTKLIDKIQVYLRLLEAQQFNKIYAAYQSCLYRKEVAMLFESSKKNERFSAKIIAVSKKGQLILQLDDDSLEKFDTKEIRFATT